MKILLRCDYGHNIGMGHLKRCEVLVDLLTTSTDVVYIVDYQDDIHLQELLNNHQIPFHPVPLENQEKVVRFIDKEGIDLFILDSYFLNAQYERIIREKTLVFVLDDLFQEHDCDFLLNHNLHSKVEQYKGLVPENAQVFCGKHFSLMSKKLQQLKGTVVQPKYDYFISMGATDHNNLMPSIIEILPKTSVAVATTSLNPNLTALQAYCAKQQHVDLFVDNDNIGRLMKQAKLALVSASTLMIEAVYLNCVFIAINTVDNQSRNTRFLKSLDFPILSYLSLQVLKEILVKVEQNYVFYQEKVQLLSQEIGLKTHTLKYEVQHRIEATRKNTKA